MTTRNKRDDRAAPGGFSRRAFLQGRTVQVEPALRPPWSEEAGLADQCTRCGDCIDACPEGVLTIGEGGFPAFDPRAGRGACTFCRACAEVCPVELFRPSDERPWNLRARIETESCLAAAGIHCETCRDSCPEQAVRFSSRIGGPPLPEVRSAVCNGCGACVATCPVEAISLHHLVLEETAA